MAIESVRLKTSGLHCSSCSMLVDMTLSDLDGVTESKTDHATGDTFVTFDPDVTNVDAFISAIREIGYDAETAA
jgi:copper chaperone